MKQRFSTLDVTVIAHELSKSLVNLRLTNIYDLSSKIFLLKFAKPNQREQLLVDSGFRCHLTRFNRTTAAAPSPFVSRLRKCLRTRRVTSVSQVGTDRIVDIAFGDGHYRLFLEFYAGGNVVLTDRELTVIALLRTVAKGEGLGQEELRVGVRYAIEERQNYRGVAELTGERVKERFESFVQRDRQGAVGGKRKGKKADAVRRALSDGFPKYPPILLDHAFRVLNFDTTTPLEKILEDERLLKSVLLVLQEAEKVTIAVTSNDRPKGYIIAKPIQKSLGVPFSIFDLPTEEQRDHAGLLYDDFHPFKPQQFEDNSDLTIVEHDGFNKTVDEFFSSLESQKLESRLNEREANAKRKLDAAKQDQMKRLGALQEVQELHIRKAEAIEANIERVEEAIGAVNGLIGQGMDWVEIARLIEMEQKKENPVAQIIKLPLKLYENTVTLLLGEASLEQEEDDEGYETDSDIDSNEEVKQEASKTDPIVGQRLAIDIDLALSPWSNAREYYDQKRSAAVKEQKTLLSSSIALQSTERKINADLKRELKQEKQVLRPARKQFWFEKFIFFISSDGYLVIGGKDAQQNEILYRRYLKKGDVYVHADLQGASSVIVKNTPNTPDAPIPPSTLSQAGTLSVCTSSAWDSKAVMAAWWVNFDQVSKTAPTGEYLTTGGFMIRGKKNFLPPAQLILGFGVIWQISEESKAKHVKHRLQENNQPVLQRPIDEEGADTEKDVDEQLIDDYAEGDDEEVTAATENNLDQDTEDQISLEDERQGEDDDGGDDPSEDEVNPLQAHQRTLTEKEKELTTVSKSEDRDNPRTEHPPKSTEENVPHVDEQESDEEVRDSDFKMYGALQPPASSTSTEVRPTKHLSAKQRRLIKKGKQVDTSPPPNTQDSAENSDIEHPSSLPTGTSTPNSQVSKSQPQQPRGKRSKAKKAASKYANQDEEDRQLAMRLLGSTAERKAAEDTASKAAKAAEAELAKQRRREQHVRATEKTKEHEEIRALMKDAEGIGELDEDEKAEMSLWDNLVGTPFPGDEILAAIPVCAPWSALGRYKYKVKLQPGAMKKGKAVREIVSKWGAAGKNPKVVDTKEVDSERVWPREVELITGWREAEIVGVVPVGKVRVVSGGGLSGSTGSKGGGGGGGQGKGKAPRGGRGGKRR